MSERRPPVAVVLLVGIATEMACQSASDHLADRRNHACIRAGQRAEAIHLFGELVDRFLVLVVFPCGIDQRVRMLVVTTITATTAASKSSCACVRPIHSHPWTTAAGCRKYATRLSRLRTSRAEPPAASAIPRHASTISRAAPISRAWALGPGPRGVPAGEFHRDPTLVVREDEPRIGERLREIACECWRRSSARSGLAGRSV